MSTADFTQTFVAGFASQLLAVLVWCLLVLAAKRLTQKVCYFWRLSRLDVEAREIAVEGERADLELKRLKIVRKQAQLNARLDR